MPLPACAFTRKQVQIAKFDPFALFRMRKVAQASSLPF
jgi:hypothetical protein